MEIHTKYHVGDEVWIMRNNKPEKIRIDGIEIEVTGGTIPGTGGILSGELYTKVWYVEIQRKEYRCAGDKDPVYHHNECACFGTKKDLLDSFLNDDE